MPQEIDARKVSLAVKQGFDRMRRFRKARAMFIREYVGNYYAKEFGLTGNEPINLIYHVIRAWVPNLIMKNPISQVGTEMVPYREYANLLGLGLDWLNRQTKLKDVLRGGIVDASFLMSIFKTGIAGSGKLLNFGDVLVDEGQVYTDLVDLDDFTFDPSTKVFTKSAFYGDRNRVSRQILLDDDRCDHDLVMKLPKSSHPDAKRKVEALSKTNMSDNEMFELQDFVDVVDLYVPGANALLRIPDPEQVIFDDYIMAEDFYGPKEGPYTRLALTQPVPGNPIPIAPVGIFYDLHTMANKVMTKLMNQAGRQKDVAIVDPNDADLGEDLRDEADGGMVLGNPESVKVVSYGGQNVKNEAMLGSLMTWFNYMSGNPEQMAGLQSRAETATQATLLQANAAITIEDARDMVYDCGAEINRKQAWYLHTDPFINLPFSKREPGNTYTQLKLTPEQRRGDFLDYTFKLKARSMSRLDPAIKSKRVVEFATNITPSIMNTGMVAMQMGLPFNVQQALTDAADELGILEEVQDWFHDPQFMQRVELMMKMGPQPAGKAQPAQGGPRGIPQQNKVMSPFQEQKQTEQIGANESQSARTSEPGV